MKIVAFILTFLINIVAGVVVFFLMLLAMNGYSESDASYGLGAYIVLAIIVTLLMSTGAAFVAHVLLKRKYTSLVSVLIAVPIFSVIGVGLKIVCSVIGVAIAEYVRVNY